jgi:hypothetical protein
MVEAERLSGLAFFTFLVFFLPSAVCTIAPQCKINDASLMSTISVLLLLREC